MQSFEAGIKKMLAATQLDEQQKLLLDVTVRCWGRSGAAPPPRQALRAGR